MKSALFVIDVQKIYTNKGSDMYCEGAAKTVDKINQLITQFEIMKMPVIYIRHIHKSDGSDIGRMFEPGEDFNFKEGTEEVEYDENLKRISGSAEFIKNRYSCFVNADFQNYMKTNEIECAVICGFMTNYCCVSTARDAHDLDYFVYFIIDATGAPEIDKELNQKKIREVIGKFLDFGGVADVLKTTDYLKKDI